MGLTRQCHIFAQLARIDVTKTAAAGTARDAWEAALDVPFSYLAEHITSAHAARGFLAATSVAASISATTTRAEAITSSTSRGLPNEPKPSPPRAPKLPSRAAER